MQSNHIMLPLSLFALLFTFSLSCSCSPTTFEEDFCYSNVTVVATVVAAMDNCPGTCDKDTAHKTGGERTFILRVQETLRGEAPEDGVVFIKEPIRNPLLSCPSVVLPVGNTKYLINLPPQTTDANACPTTYSEFGLCNTLKKWKELTPDQVSYVRNANCAPILRAW